MSILVEKIDAGLRKHKRLTPSSFQRIILDFYASQGRSFPWRETTNAYRIAVSEVMLQQTQTQRVLEKYGPFLKRFPSWQRLAQASTSDVLTEWQGLGYYRRALNLHRAAKLVVTEHGGKLPTSVADIRALPGFGPYTAAAVLTFATNKPYPMLETNIRDLYLYAFFGSSEGVSDKEILQVVEETMDCKEPRRWFYALMDAGVELKKTRPGVNRRSKHYTQQSAFIGSHRQVRAAVLKFITNQGSVTPQSIYSELLFAKERIDAALAALCRDEFLVATRSGRYRVR